MLYVIHDFIEGYDFDPLFNALQTTEDVFIDIDSCGGNLRTAWKMYDAIRMHEGNVYVNVSGDCMSAAILPLLAAKPENRFANANAQFLIHKPLLDWWGLLKDEDCKAISAEIGAETAKLKETYMERTKATESELDTMINAEQVFGCELALALGFIGKKNEYINKTHKKMSKKMSKVETLLRNVLVKGGFLNQKEYTTADDETFIVETDEEPKVGDETPNEDGLYILPDGTKFTVADGVITAIETLVEDSEEEEEKEEELKNEGEEEKKEDDDEEKKEMENLRNQVASLKEKASAYDRISALVNKCGGEERLSALLNAQSKQAKQKSEQKSEDKEDDEYEHFRKL